MQVIRRNRRTSRLCGGACNSKDSRPIAGRMAPALSMLSIAIIMKKCCIAYKARSASSCPTNATRRVASLPLISPPAIASCRRERATAPTSARRALSALRPLDSKPRGHVMLSAAWHVREMRSLISCDQKASISAKIWLTWQRKPGR